MDVQPAPQAAKKGSMLPFWLVIGTALMVLVIYVAFFMTSGAPMRNKPMDPGTRRAAPPAMLEPVVPSGDPVQLLTLKGDVVVLHFWATWCAPCREEFPEFAQYATSDRVPRGVDIFAISMDEKPDVIPKFLSRIPKSPVIYMDPEGLADRLQVTGYPTTIILDKAGRVSWRSMGVANWSDSGVPAVIKELNGE
jgi:thiol-disulfide isomerase/thioredoxin